MTDLLNSLFLWPGKPVTLTLDDGEPLHVLFLDTEGLGDVDNQDHDAPVMLLATLLCSTLVYNW